MQRAILLSVLVLVLVACASPTPTPTAPTATATPDILATLEVLMLMSAPQKCEELVPHIIELSKEQDNPFSAEILKISNIQKHTPTGDKILECSGDARWSMGGDDPLEFYLEEDKDGDLFYGYQRL